MTGRAGPINTSFDGSLHVSTYSVSSDPTFQPQCWPVTDSYFKALVPLEPFSTTSIKFVFQPPSSFQGHSKRDVGTTINVHYTPLSQNPPLHLVVLAASDSQLTIDCPPDRRDAHAHLSAVIAKMQLWAYMSQSFTAEDNRRNGLRRRTFALDEQEGPDTLECIPAIQKRRRPVVHFIRSSHSLKDFRDPDNTQQVCSMLWEPSDLHTNAKGNQNKNAKRAGAMHEFATEALGHPSAPSCFRNPNGAYVAVLLLDAHWDPQRQLLLAHAALGAGGPVSQGCKIGVFGSHSCWSWPRTLTEVAPAFMDCSDVVNRFLSNSCVSSS